MGQLKQALAVTKNSDFGHKYYKKLLSRNQIFCTLMPTYLFHNKIQIIFLSMYVSVSCFMFLPCPFIGPCFDLVGESTKYVMTVLPKSSRPLGHPHLILPSTLASKFKLVQKNVDLSLLLSIISGSILSRLRELSYYCFG